MPRFCASCGAQMGDAATACPACGKAAAQSVGGGAAAATAPAATTGGGLSDNTASGLAYITIIPAIAFLLIEPYNHNKTVKFHAFQCLGLAAVSIACSMILVIPILGWIIGILGHLTVFVCWLICVVKAFGGGRFKLPVIGDFAEKQANA
jgi:uncharacterized membrane protein